MIWIIGMPFAALIVAILVVRIMRRAVNARDLRGFEVTPLDRRRPSDDFHDTTWRPLCEKVAQAISARLGRPLNESERRMIWRARTPLALEVALKEIETARDATAVEQILAVLPTGLDRPDPTGWCRRDL